MKVENYKVSKKRKNLLGHLLGLNIALNVSCSTVSPSIASRGEKGWWGRSPGSH